jgi:carbamoyltransferase
MGDYFAMGGEQDSPYMLLVAPVQDSVRDPAADGALREKEGLEKLPVRRSDVPAITHVDYSARVQTADAGRHGRYHKLLKAFERKTGCPVLINTSFNVRGEPIVCTPEDAYKCFMGTNMDVLVMDRFVLLKEEQPAATQHEVDAYLAKFELD